MNAISPMPALPALPEWHSPGVYDGIPEAKYHASPGVSVSRLKRFAKAAAKAQGPQEDTEALRFGTLAHTVLLEPDAVEARFWVSDLETFNARHKAYQEELERAGGLPLVKRADYEAALRLRDAVYANSTAREVLGGHRSVEQSFYWHDAETGLLCRGRADLVRHDWNALVDLKSTEDASREGFRQALRRYRYSWQSAYYQWGYGEAAGKRPETLIFLAVEKEPPFLSQAFEVEQADLDLAEAEIRKHLRDYADCERSGEWPGYADGITPIGLSDWDRRRALDALEGRHD